jgi:hypothetical protein
MMPKEKLGFGVCVAGWAVAAAASWFAEFGGRPEFETPLLVVASIGIVIGFGLAFPYMHRHRKAARAGSGWTAVE